jgi:NAD+ synthase
MPQGVQSDIDYAKELVALLNIKNYEVNISDTVNAEINSLKTAGVEITDDILINTPARIRMATLYAISAANNGRVCNTCNKSEDFVGYATKFGDGAGDFSLLSNLTVTEVKEIGRKIGLPDKFIDKTPIDGLDTLQRTDEQKLGFSYAFLDDFIRIWEESDRNYDLLPSVV